MKRRNLVGVLTCGFTLCLFGLVSVNAQAGSWVASAFSWITNTTDPDPVGDLGPGGDCYNTYSSTSVISLSLVNVTTAEASATGSRGQSITWVGSGTPPELDVDLGASVSGVFESGATDGGTIASTAEANCDGDDVYKSGSASYPGSYAFSPVVLYEISPEGEGGTFLLVLSSSADSKNKGAYSYGEGSGVWATGPSGGCDASAGHIKKAAHKKVIKRAATSRPSVKLSAK